MRLTLSVSLCILLLWTSAAFAQLDGSGPVVTISGTGIDPVQTNENPWILQTTLDAGTDIQFCWEAAAGSSGSENFTYRYGWDIIDPGDPFDPAWAVPETDFDGSEVCSPVQVFSIGYHVFVVTVTDGAGLTTRIAVQVSINQTVDAGVRSWGALKGQH